MLGPLELVDGRHSVDVGGARQRRLLHALLTDVGEAVTVERLLERVWDEAEQPANQEPSLRTYISRLRLALPQGDRLVVTRRGGYALELNGHDVDADRFDALVAELRREPTPAPAAQVALASRR